jgi:hypothetical protein
MIRDFFAAGDREEFLPRPGFSAHDCRLMAKEQNSPSTKPRLSIAIRKDEELE